MQVSLAEGKTIICQNNPQAITISSTTPPGFNFIYQWYKDNKPIPQANASFITVKEAGTYFVEIRVPAGCSAFSEKRIIEMLESPVVELGEDINVCPANPIILDAGNIGKGFTYRWSDGSTGQTLEVKQTGEYKVTVSNKICSVSDIIQVVINQNEDVFIPNLITPGNDDKNETFKILNQITKEKYPGKIKLILYNRWGKPVWQTTDYQNNWSAEGLPDGMYFYHISHEENCFQARRGWVNVIKSN